MGLTGGRLVKSVFSRSRSAASSHDNSHVNGRQERRRWRRSVRSYLCGDEFNSSVVAEEDSASIKSSEVVVTVLLQPPHDLSGLAGEEEEEEEGEKNSNSDFTLDEEDHAAAIVIQSAFRRFQARRQCRGVDDGEERRSVEEKDEEMVGLGLGLEGGISSPSRAESIGTSIEVQTANSVKAFSVVDETVAVGNHRAHQQQQQQLRSRTQQLFKTKDEWDDSTVSSNISKMRVQHRLEAMTRRERALAYAFSQQLRICSKKRTVQLESEERGADMGWSWLERWMATRVPDNNNKYNKDTTTTTTTQEQEQEQELLQQVESAGRLVLGKRLVDLAAAVAVEKESCGSNSVSLHLDSEDTENNNNTNNIPIPTNPLLRRKCVTKRQCQRVHAQISSKKVSTKEAVMDKRKKQKQQLQEINEKNQCPNDDTESDNSFTAASKLLG